MSLDFDRVATIERSAPGIRAHDVPLTIHNSPFTIVSCVHPRQTITHAKERDGLAGNERQQGKELQARTPPTQSPLARRTLRLSPVRDSISASNASEVRIKRGIVSIEVSNKYVNFVSDEHLIECIGNLHASYLRAKNNLSKRTFYTNKIDTIKLSFDAEFNELDEEALVQAEILRQIDKSINNSIGTFHEEVLGGIDGFEVGNLSGFDVKATDDTLFADIKNKHNTMNSSAAKLYL